MLLASIPQFEEVPADQGGRCRMVAFKTRVIEANRRRFTSEYLQPPPPVEAVRERRKGARRLLVGRKGHHDVLAEMVKLVRRTVHKPSHDSYMKALEQDLPAFARLLDAYLTLRPQEAAAGEASELLERFQRWGGDYRADQVEHAMALMGRSGKIVARVVDRPVPDSRYEEDVRLAQSWMVCRAGYAFELLGAVEISRGATMFDDQGVVDSVFSDLVGFAREALHIAREAYDLRHPESVSGDEGDDTSHAGSLA